MRGPQTRILVGDARRRLAELPDGSVHCVVTSPPYWGLREYGNQDAMIGLEPSFDAHVENLVCLFREVRRVLRSDGTLWLNYGDAYASSPPGRRTSWESSGLHGAQSDQYQSTLEQSVQQKRNTVGGIFKAKDLMMMPARVALALHADGWWLRSEVIWGKPNPLPESTTDRPTSAHEKIFLFSKNPTYFYDADAVRANPEAGANTSRANQRLAEDQAIVVLADEASTDAHNGKVVERGANLRNIWMIATKPFHGSHFATFPPELPERCIKAGTSEHGVCGRCGAPWRRVPKGSTSGGQRERDACEPPKTVGWEPGCDCGADRVPATVLDPFAGSGTVGLVAQRLHRSSVLIEIDSTYAQMVHDRLYDDNPMFADMELVL